MKKPIAIVCVLLLLVAFIGVERFNAHGRRLSEKPKTENFRAEKPRVTNKPRIRSSESHIPQDATNSVKPAHGEARQNKPDSGTTKPAPIAGNTAPGRQIKAMHYIRSKRILGTDKPDESSVARLKEAVKRVAATTHVESIMDLDGNTTSQSPFLVFANPRFDLTNEVHAVYRALAPVDAAAENSKTSPDGLMPPN
jgi:hypothetical protein